MGPWRDMTKGVSGSTCLRNVTNSQRVTKSTQYINRSAFNRSIYAKLALVHFVAIVISKHISFQMRNTGVKIQSRARLRDIFDLHPL